MGKDPAFLFYFQDYSFGVKRLDRRHRGAYVDLLIEQADKHIGSNNYKMTLEEIKEVLDGDFDTWEKLQNKFIKKDELYWNKKQYETVRARKEFSKSRRNNRLGKTKKDKLVKNTSYSHHKLVEDINEDEIKDEDINESKDQNSIEDIKEIVNNLNITIGAKYRYTTKKNQDLIRARLNEKFTKEDFFIVHQKKNLEWGSDPKFAKFLRPQTLWGTKFESYLNQISVQEKSKMMSLVERTIAKYGNVS